LGLLLNLIITLKAAIKYKKSIEFVSFILLLSPLIYRMSQVPLEVFNYWEFNVPFGLFILCFLLYLMFYKPSSTPYIKI
jgi:uncharacterized protein involved in response to NO